MPAPVRQEDFPPVAGSEPLTVQIAPELPGPVTTMQTPAERQVRPAPRMPAPVPLARAPVVQAPPEPSPAVSPLVKDAPLPPLPPTEPPVDMAAMIRANRERRRLAEGAQARGPMASGPQAAGPAAGAAALSRNLQTLAGDGGAGGVFQILRVGARSGSFAFNGWRGGAASRVRREVFEVDAGADGDVEIAMVRKMITLIREDYPGDFRWESRRQGRVVTLSAAPDQGAELEDYLMREFFDSPARRAP